jgi:hypothetical protein
MFPHYSGRPKVVPDRNLEPCGNSELTPTVASEQPAHFGELSLAYRKSYLIAMKRNLNEFENICRTPYPVDH